MNPPPAADHLLRDLAPQVLGAIVRRYGDFAAAEDAVQEALIAAAVQWPSEGVPENPRGWLIQVAARRMTDHIRSELARRRRETTAAGDLSGAPSADSLSLAYVGTGLDASRSGDLEHDDTLLLLFPLDADGRALREEIRRAR